MVRVVVVLRVGLPVFPDVGQTVRFRRVGPPVGTLADVIVLVSACGSLPLGHNGIGPLREQFVRIGNQLPVGGEELRISPVKGVLHPGQDCSVQLDQRTSALFLCEKREREGEGSE